MEKTQNLQKEKRPWKIRRQLVVGFGIFTLVIVVLLWTFQISLLTPFYRQIKISEVTKAADSLVRSLALSNEELNSAVQELCYTTGINIVVSDELGSVYAGWRASEKDSLLGESLTRVSLIKLFNDVNLQGSDLMDTYPSPFVSRDGSRADVILYARIVHTQGGDNRMILMESEITPVDSTVETLKVQLICLTVVMVLLGSVLAIVIARRVSRPIVAINESAKALARGNYAISFEETGSREVRELAQTLSYAAGELSKVDGLRRELLANVSHDLRTPLTMIKGYSEVMRDLPGENTPANVQIIVDEASRLTDLVNDLLDLSRLESGVVSIHPARFNLTESIRAILTRYDKLADYSFPFSFARDVFIAADELKISQVVYNLVNNAITYAGEDKTVSLAQTEHENFVRISVSDTGEGIPADKLRDIWERYYKVDREHKRAQVGTGLGLSIVKNILDLHGGTYGVESQPEKGSTFWFELPVAPEESPKLD